MATQRIARLMQRSLGDIFLHHTKSVFGTTLITVTAVIVSPDLHLAKVYLSLMEHPDEHVLLQKIKQHAAMIKHALSQKISQKIRKTPNLRFYLDDTIQQASHIEQVLTQDAQWLTQHTNLIDNQKAHNTNAIQDTL